MHSLTRICPSFEYCYLLIKTGVFFFFALIRALQLSRPPLPSDPVEVVDSELERLSDPKGLTNLPPLLRTVRRH